MKKNPKKLKIYVPWQHRFIAGLFKQLDLSSDRETALYLQKESSFPSDGLGEETFRNFAKGLQDLPKAWKKIINKKCDQRFIERWKDKLHQPPPEPPLSQEKHPEKIPNKPRLAFSKQKAMPTKTSPISDSSKKIIRGEAESNPLPDSILKILKISLLEALDEEAKLSPGKLARALKKRSAHYKIKIKGRTIFFSGKRITHRFDIPSEIELVAR